jgi:hypothetical protein
MLPTLKDKGLGFEREYLERNFYEYLVYDESLDT